MAKMLVIIKGRGHLKTTEETGQRRRSRNYDNYGSHSQVAADIKTILTKEMTA
jgi:hypothetical protein